MVVRAATAKAVTDGARIGTRKVAWVLVDSTLSSAATVRLVVASDVAAADHHLRLRSAEVEMVAGAMILVLLRVLLRAQRSRVIGELWACPSTPRNRRDTNKTCGGKRAALQEAARLGYMPMCKLDKPKSRA